MSNIIKGNFLQHNDDLPEHFTFRWMDAHHERCIAPESWTYHVGIRVYQTPKRWAFQAITGVGTQPARYPKTSRLATEPWAFSYGTPIYSNDLNKLWKRVFKWLESRNTVLPEKLLEIQKQIKTTPSKRKAPVTPITSKKCLQVV